MNKVIAVLRSLVLLVILVLAFANTPFEVFGSGDSMVAVRGIRKLVQATWIAIGWIAIETAIAWVKALRKPKVPKAPKGSPKSPETADPGPPAQLPS